MANLSKNVPGVGKLLLQTSLLGSNLLDVPGQVIPFLFEPVDPLRHHVRGPAMLIFEKVSLNFDACSLDA